MSNIINNPLLYLWRRMWQYSADNRRNVVIYIGIFILANIVNATEPLIVGLLLNTLQLEGVHPSNLPHLLLLLSLFPLQEFLFWALHGPARLMESKNAFIVRANYKNYLLRGTLAMPIEWHTDHHSGDTIDKIEKGTTALYHFSERTFEVLQGILQLVIAFGAMLFYDRTAGLFVLAVTMPMFYILFLFDKQLIPGYKVVNKLENNISAKIFDILSNVTSVIILRVESLVLTSIATFIEKPFAPYYRNSKINEWKWFTASILGRSAVIAAIGIYLFTHAQGATILVGTIYILYGYGNQIRETLFRFAYLYNDVVRYRASVSNAEELSHDFQEANWDKKKRLPKTWSQLTITALSFSYHPAEGADLHLDNIYMPIASGERIALIGESGGGKSTFLKVMRDLYHPKALTLTLDGKKLPKGFATISDAISLVPQDPEIFATTIRENITLGVDYTDEHIQIFTDMACFTETIKRLPKGLDSSIVEKGVNLSGGEKQRLALSRGLLASQDKDIVLLDEPTSSVDFHNELTIYKNIFDAFPKQTIISSIHRLHLLSLFDRVYFFKDGKIIAAGTANELKKSSPDFQALWEKYIKTRDAES